MAMHELQCESFIPDYHIYKDIWSSTIGEHLLYERVTLNLTDRYAIAVLKHDIIIGYLPRLLSRICFVCIARG